jgi:hypothetical protein
MINKTEIFESSLVIDARPHIHRCVRRENQKWWSVTVASTLRRLIDDKSPDPLLKLHTKGSDIVRHISRKTLVTKLGKKGGLEVVLPGIRFSELQEEIRRIRVEFPFIHLNNFKVRATSGDGTPHIRIEEKDLNK